MIPVFISHRPVATLLVSLESNYKNLLDEFRVELAATGRAAGTITVRLSHARRCLQSIGKPVSEVSREDIVTWLASPSWGAAARASARASIRVFWSWLERRGIASDITADIPSVIQPRAIPRPAPEKAVLSALAHAPADIQTAIELMALCGLRRAEVARVRGEHVEESGGYYALRVEGKGGHIRRVPMPPRLARLIMASPGWHFPGGDDGHISPGWLGKRISRVLPPGITPHSLRHRYATTVYSQSRDIRAVQDLLGHASVATTQVYVGLSPDAHHTAASSAWRYAA